MLTFLSHAVEDFLLAKDLTPRSRDWYTKSLGAFARWCEEHGVRDVESVDTRLLRQYFRYHQTRKTSQGRLLSSKTISGYYLAVGGFLRWCVKEYDLPVDPTNKLEGPKMEEKIVPVFTRAQVDALLKASKESPHPYMAARDYALVTTLLDTGIRLSELCALRLEGVKLDAADPYLLIDGKGRKQREVGLGRMSRRALDIYIKVYRSKFKDASASPYVFIARTGKPLNMGSIDVLMHVLKERTGITDVRLSAHTFRHTMAATYLAQPGADVYKLARLLGHSKVATTELYLRAFEQRQARHGTSVLDSLTNH